MREHFDQMHPGWTGGPPVEPREGIITAYDYDGRCVGCVGEETWARLLAGAVVLSAEQVAQVRERRDLYAERIASLPEDEDAAWEYAYRDALGWVLAPRVSAGSEHRTSTPALLTAGELRETMERFLREQGWECLPASRVYPLDRWRPRGSTRHENNLLLGEAVDAELSFALRRAEEKRESIYLVRCPACGAEGPQLGGFEAGALIEDWDGATYLFSCCGHRAHLDASNGGAVTWIEGGKP